MDILERKKRLEKAFVEEELEKKAQVEKKHREKIESIFKDMILYPKAKDVLEDEELECVFRPLLTIKRNIKGKEFLIHVLLSLGITEERLSKGYLFSENGFFGFDYNDGKYKYLGSKDVFWDYNQTKGLNLYLQADFIEQKEIYLSKKITMEVYIDRIMEKIGYIVQLGSYDSLRRYLKSFYSYELTKYQYQATGNFRSYKEITKGCKTNSDFISNEECIYNITDEFLINIEYNLKNSYEITPDMACFGIEAFNFMEYKDILITLVDEDNERVYMLEYYS